MLTCRIETVNFIFIFEYLAKLKKYFVLQNKFNCNNFVECTLYTSYSFSQPPCSRFEQWWEILHQRRTKMTRRKYDRWYVIIKIIIFIILNGFLPNFYYLKFSVLLLLGIFYSKFGNCKKIQWQQCRQAVTTLCPIKTFKGYRNFNLFIIFILSFVFLHMQSSIFLCVMGSVFIYIITFIIEINTVLKLAHK